MSQAILTRRASTPVAVQISRRPALPAEQLTDIEFVNVEETVLSANRCSCSSGDDAPY